MKKCSYCGKEYPNEAVTCVIDGQLLSGPASFLKKVTGVWRGVYGYGTHGALAAMPPVGFTLKLKQGWFSRFTGSVIEDAPHGATETGRIDGYFGPPKLEFTKQMPVGYIARPNGGRMTLREYFNSQGYACEKEIPSSILYLGTFLDSGRVQGTWLIQSRRISLRGGFSFKMASISGFWCAKFMTATAGVDLTGGPTEPLFDKTLLSPLELEQVESVAYRSLGKFEAVDANRFTDQFWQMDIRFHLKPDDEARGETMRTAEVQGGDAGSARMVEIFVHPDDEAKAWKITGVEPKSQV